MRAIDEFDLLFERHLTQELVDARIARDRGHALGHCQSCRQPQSRYGHDDRGPALFHSLK